MHLKWIVVAFLAATLATGCSRQETGWRQAAKRDTVAAYEEYLGRFPAGAYSAEAHARILELREAEAWALAERVRAPEAWQRYLAAWPEGQHAPAARRELADFAPIVPAAPISGHAAQLGAYSSESAARTDLARLLRDHAELLEGQGWQVTAPAAGAASLWRLRVGPLTEPAARELCASLKSRGVDCVPVSG